MRKHFAAIGATHAPPIKRVQKKVESETAYVVISCPDDEFPAGGVFSQTDVQLSLKDGCWPEGMVFQRLTGTKQLIVSGQALVNDGGGLCRA